MPSAIISPLMNIYYCVCSYVSEKKLTFCNEIATHVSNEKIPADLVVNWDQTPLHYIPACKWTMDDKGTSKIPIAGGLDKRARTTIFTVTLSGNCLPMQLIYMRRTAQSLPKFTLFQMDSHSRKIHLIGRMKIQGSMWRKF